MHILINLVRTSRKKRDSNKNREKKQTLAEKLYLEVEVKVLDRNSK